MIGMCETKQALVVEAEERQEPRSADSSFFEVTLASCDAPKLLSRLSECLVSFPASVMGAGRAPACTLQWGHQVLVSLNPERLVRFSVASGCRG
jgi:hypothetical protein